MVAVHYTLAAALEPAITGRLLLLVAHLADLVLVAAVHALSLQVRLWLVVTAAPVSLSYTSIPNDYQNYVVR